MPQTNMVFPSLSEDCKLAAAEVATRLLADGIKIGVVGEKKFRMVTHYLIDDEAIEKTIRGFEKVLR